MPTKKTSQPLKIGDRVQILYSDLRGRIVEFRGPLGPGGKLIYRVRIQDKPKARYIELREDQLVFVPPQPNGEPSPLTTTPRSNPTPPKVHSKARRSSNG